MGYFNRQSIANADSLTRHPEDVRAWERDQRSAQTHTTKGTNTMISDQTAQRIASEWHGGGGSALYQFSSTGAIVPGLGAEIQDNLRWCWAHREEHAQHIAARELMSLRDYVSTTGERGPVADWHSRVICA
jgi:hypothetical protein